MRCTHCGAVIPDGQIICPECGTQIQIVPDYNPLDDVLTREVKGSVEGATRQIQTNDLRRYRGSGSPGNENSTRVLSETEMERIRGRGRGRQQTDADRQKRSGDMRRPRQGTGELRRQNTGELRRMRQQKRLEEAKRKRRNVLIMLFVILLVICAGVYLAYQNSYTGMLKKGYRAIQSRDYDDAQSYFERAVVKDKSRAEAYDGLAEIYIDQNDNDSAEQIYLKAIETQPTNEKLYQAAIDFYMETEQPEKISDLLKDCEDSGVLKSVQDYISTAPEFSPEEGEYSEVQEITLTSETGGDIYYTTDGTDPTVETGTKYTEPVLLQKEGTTEIRAIAVNEKGIPSVVSSSVYSIEFPIADAPAVTPSTGQYTSPEQIVITVPEGYTAYYTMDGSTPTSQSTQYTGPIDMPENARTIFNAVLINNQNGKATSITTRNYITTSE